VLVESRFEFLCLSVAVLLSAITGEMKMIILKKLFPGHVVRSVPAVAPYASRSGAETDRRWLHAPNVWVQDFPFNRMRTNRVFGFFAVTLTADLLTPGEIPSVVRTPCNVGLYEVT